MSLCYSKVVAELPAQVREIPDYKKIITANTIQSNSELYLETTEVHEDSSGNLWIYCPKNKMYYELYRKSINKSLIELYPTITAEVTSDCKAGLAFYSDHDSASEILDRRMPGDTYDVTADFFVDNKNNIWIGLVELDETDRGYDKKIGWTIYKNNRNNFANLYIRGSQKIVTTNGELDKNKVDEFKKYLLDLRFNWMYKYTDNPFQLFALTEESDPVNGGAISYISTVPTVKLGAIAPKAKRIPVQPKKTSKAITKDYGNRTPYPWKGRDRSVAHIQHNARPIVLNSRSFPEHIGRKRKIHKYDYFMDYASDGVLNSMDTVRSHFNLNVQSYQKLYNRLTSQYNRFKLANPNDPLMKGFPHVFFTRPDCNFYTSEKGTELQAKPGADPNVQYMFHHKKELIDELTQMNSEEWLHLLSNKAGSFSVNDESIGFDTYGKTFHGYSVAYGKLMEGMAAGSFNITYNDTRELDVLNVHKLWVEYISNVFSGKWMPKNKYIWRKIIDYACSVYYIITGEDGETILFWSKYYGVFPTNIPSSAYSWTVGSPVSNPSMDITYQYTTKKDLDPYALIEFNLNSHINKLENIKYVPIYNPHINSTGTTWVGDPFIEVCQDSPSDYYFKLRFQPK